MNQQILPIGSQQGITMVELLIVMSITGILVMATIPSFQSAKEKRLAESAAEILVATLQRARIYHPNARGMSALSFKNTTNEWCYCISESLENLCGDEDCVRGSMVKSTHFKGVRLERPTDNTAIFRVDTGFDVGVVVAKTSSKYRIRICKPNGSKISGYNANPCLKKNS